MAMCREDANECTGKSCRLYLVIGENVSKLKLEIKINLFYKYMFLDLIVKDLSFFYLFICLVIFLRNRGFLFALKSKYQKLSLTVE